MSKLSIGGALVAVLTSLAIAQGRDNRIGDDYARAALRAAIYMNETGVTAERVSFLLDEADVEASSPAEEASLRELNRILGVWMRQPLQDHRVCYMALKSNLKARSGATPEACK
jgi:hypothetical protein